MVTEGLVITAVGMTSVFLFLLLLVGAMNAQAAACRYLGIEDASEKASENGSGDEALIAAIAAVKLKNG